MTTLRTICDELKEIESLDMAPEDIADTLDAVSLEFDAKIEAIVNVLKNFDDRLAAIKAEKGRLADLEKTITNAKDRLKEYAVFGMESTGRKRVELPLFNVSLSKGREVAIIDDADALPEKFVAVKTTTSPDKNEIAKALKLGIPIEGAHLERGKSSIRIK